MTRTRALTWLAGTLLAAALAARPIAHGVPLTTVLVFWATALGQVVLPGALLVRGARLRGSGDPWLVVGQGATVGVALQGIAFLAGRALGAPWLTTLAALATAGAGLALDARGSPASEARARSAQRAARSGRLRWP